eukprot:12897658-Prorocentrum_lima.AAC.1
MRQEAEHEAVKLELGEKHKPKTKPEDIKFGDDDCGEDMSSIAWVEELPCPCYVGAPVYLLQEHTLAEDYRDPEHD